MSTRMKATLVRFGPDLFEELKSEAERSGISIAAYVREAVVARMAYTAGRRGDVWPDPSSPTERARSDARRVRSESAAVRAQSEQAQRHSRKLRG